MRGVSVRVLQFDSGPPVEEFPLKIQVIGEDDEVAARLAAEVQAHIDGATLVRSNNTEAQIIETKSPSMQTITRVDGAKTLVVQGVFSDDDISALLVFCGRLRKR